MTIHEASERYNIPLSVLQEYERWGLYDAGDRQKGARQYDEKDLERLSLIMTLRTIGFEGPQVEAYMQLREQEGTEGRPAGRALQTIRRNWDEDPRQSRI